MVSQEINPKEVNFMSEKLGVLFLNQLIPANCLQ